MMLRRASLAQLRTLAVMLFAAVFVAAPLAARAAAACPMDHAQACCCPDAGAKDAACELRCADSTAVPETQAVLTLPAGTPLLSLDTAAPALTGAIDGDPTARSRWRLAAHPERPSLKRYLRDCTLRL